MKRKLAVMVIAACVAVTTVTSGSGALNAEAAPQLKLASDSTEEVEEADIEEAGEADADESDGEEPEETDTEEADGEEVEEADADESDGEESEETDTDEADSETEAAEEEEEFIPVGAAEGATITVSGTGSVTVTPDSASVALGVETVDESLKTAQNDNAAAVNAVIDALLEAGVEDSSIRTSYYDLYSNYDYHSDTAELTGYTVITMLTVSGVDVDVVGDLIDAAVEAGANEVDGISYEYSDQEAAYDQALEAAIERAQDKAQMMAEKAGAVLGGVLAIIEEDSSYGTIDARSYVSEAAEYETENVSMTVLAGESTVTATVSVTFDLETPEEEAEEGIETEETGEETESEEADAESEPAGEDAADEEEEASEEGTSSDMDSDTEEVPYKEEDGDAAGESESDEEETPDDEE